MAREFRLAITVTLPEGDFDEAEALMALRPIVEAFGEGIHKIGGDAVAMNYGVVTPKPRGAKGDEAA